MIAIEGRKPDRRTEADDLRMELAAERFENRRAWKAVAITNGRVLRLLERGDAFTARRWAEQTGYIASRRGAQLDPEGSAA